MAGGESGGGEVMAGGAERAAAQEAAPAGDGRLKASPVARRMARELGVELAQLEGTGPGGRIVKADVRAAAERNGPATRAGDEVPAARGAAAAATGEAAPAEAPAAAAARAPAPERGEAGVKGAVEVQELTRLQRTVTRRMAESKATAPDFAISLDVDMTRAVELRTRLKEVADPAPSYNDMIVKAAATALREHPRVNGAYRDGRFELYEDVNVGVAVAAQDALVVPTIFGADRKSLGAIARDARELIAKVREGQITPPELGRNLHRLQPRHVRHRALHGDHQPPQSAILTVGALASKPAVDDRGRVVARDQLTLTLVCDHRILYGADGAQFLARIKELLEQPLALAL